MQQSFNIYEPNNTTILTTTVTDNSYSEGMCSYTLYPSTNGYRLQARTPQTLEDTRLGDILIASNEEGSVYLKASLDSEDGISITCKYLKMEPLIDITQNTMTANVQNLSKLGRNEVRFDDGIYMARGDAELSPYLGNRVQSEVGKYYFTYDTATQKIDKIFKKLKDDWFLTAVESDYFFLKEGDILPEVCFPEMGDERNKTRHVWFKGWRVQSGGAKLNFKYITKESNGPLAYRYRRRGRRYITVADYSGIAPRAVAGDDYVAVYLNLLDTRYKIDMVDAIIWDKSLNNVFFEGKNETELFFGRPLADEAYWEEIPKLSAFHKIGVLNQGKLVDSGLDTKTYMGDGGSYTLKSSHNFDSIALSQVSAKSVIVRVIEDGVVVEEREYLLRDEVETGVGAGDGDICDIFKPCCAAFQAPSSTSKQKIIFETLPILLEKVYANTATISVEFTGESWIGNVFTGESIALPCVSTSLSRMSRSAMAIDIEKLSGLGVLRNKKEYFNIIETRMTLHFKNYEEARKNLKIIEGYQHYLIFLALVLHKGTSLIDTYDHLSHSGVITDCQYGLKNNNVDISILQVNNTRSK